ncbi:MAG: methyltransferase [Candidatus Thorarchaeota archaeon]|jgi:protein-S-isoprenylcysteine O-methyltransferase Ste14
MLTQIELFPTLEIGWLNGWILLVVLYLAYGLLLLIFPREAVHRLYKYSRSSWSRRHRAFYAVERVLLVVYLIIVVFSPLKIGSYVFTLGLVLFSFGLTGFIIALFNFKNTPLDQPVTRGLYRVSRHPQIVMLFIAGSGIGIALGSLFAVFLQIVASCFGSSRILMEEKACLEQYGNSYRIYMERVPKYALIKTRMREENRREMAEEE